MNKVHLVGRLTKDPTITQAGGYSKATFTVAVQRNYKNSNGEYDADFILCQAWRGTADFIGKYFKKGKEIALSGKLQTRSWDADDGTKRFAMDVVVEDVEFVGSKSDNSQPQERTKLESGLTPEESAMNRPKGNQTMSEYVADMNNVKPAVNEPEQLNFDSLNQDIPF